MKEELSKIAAKVMGDLAIPCFSFAKMKRKNPALIAEELKKNLELFNETLGSAVFIEYLNLK